MTISNGSFGKSSKIYGGYSNAENGMVGGDSEDKGNKVVIDNATFNSGTSNKIYGGYAENTGGIAQYNSVTINDGTFKAASGDFGLAVAGGYAAGTAQYNAVTINGGTFSASADRTIKIIGGYSGSSDASHNTVAIKNGTFGANTLTYGGCSEDANVTSNVVEISDGEFGDNANIYGGYSKTSGDAGGDTVDSGNKVVIKNGNFNGQIYGGWSYSGSAISNSVIIDGGTFNSGITIRGGSVDYTGGDAIGNSVTINGGSFNSVELFVGYSGQNSSNNILNINTKVKGNFNVVGYAQTMNFTLPSNITNGETMLSTGALAVNGQGGTATVNVYMGEGVELDEGDVITLVSADTIFDNYIVGKIFDVAATEATPGQVYTTDLAKVTIDGTSIKLTMLGLYSNSWYGTEEGGFTRKKAEAVAEGGILNVDGAGASFAGTKFFYGGYSETDGIEVKNNTVNVTGGEFGSDKNIYGGYSQSGPANNNTVNISGGTFNDGYKLYGGKGTASSGNTLNLKTKVGGKAAEVGYFQTMNFTLPTGIQAGDVMLATQSVAYDSTVIGVTAAEGVILRKNDVITLVEADNVTGGIDTTNLTVLDGAAIVSLEEGKNLILTLLKDFGIKGGEEDRQKAPVEGIAAAVQTVNMSADLASGEGMRSLILETVGGFTNTFGALTAGHSKYKTGSHVDVDGWGVVVGAGKTKEWVNGEATSLGVFLEYGKGNFDTYNGSIHGDGNSENKGIGFMMRHKMLNNTYYEGNIRYGKVETDWSESEVGGYNTDSKYYGISVGMGHIFPAGKNEIDVYGRYTYGHVGSSDARVGTKDYHFDSAKSHRVRIGGKYNFKQKNSNAKPFVGLAWEYEFKGESKASIAGVGEAPAPSMKGNTGIMEVGCDWNLGKKWTAGISANAYVGKRQGWDGMARIVYNF
ncbi:MAG: autotransporter domain-containing protein [Acidaminococcaceae bacterium]|nr:autotransporter domain-containing protein [Acidaminococcaceae bacterium]